MYSTQNYGEQPWCRLDFARLSLRCQSDLVSQANAACWPVVWISARSIPRRLPRRLPRSVPGPSSWIPSELQQTPAKIAKHLGDKAGHPQGPYGGYGQVGSQRHGKNPWQNLTRPIAGNAPPHPGGQQAQNNPAPQKGALGFAMNPDWCLPPCFCAT